MSCPPVSAPERAAARGADAASQGGQGQAGLQISKGWFGAAAAGAGGGAAAPAGGYAWQLAERLYSSAQYALAFQLALAPEASTV